MQADADLIRNGLALIQWERRMPRGYKSVSVLQISEKSQRQGKIGPQESQSFRDGHFTYG